jgi:hypothetical protein
MYALHAINSYKNSTGIIKHRKINSVILIYNAFFIYNLKKGFECFSLMFSHFARLENIDFAFAKNRICMCVRGCLWVRVRVRVRVCVTVQKGNLINLASLSYSLFGICDTVQVRTAYLYVHMCTFVRLHTAARTRAHVLTIAEASAHIHTHANIYRRTSAIIQWFYNVPCNFQRRTY